MATSNGIIRLDNMIRYDAKIKRYIKDALEKIEATGASEMIGSTETDSGRSGSVPAPSAGKATRFLRCDGVWEVPPGNYGNATTTTAGVVRIGSNISVTTGIISIVKSNIISALGYTPLSGITVVDEGVSTDIASRAKIQFEAGENISLSADNTSGKVTISSSIVKANIISALGYTPLSSINVTNEGVSTDIASRAKIQFEAGENISLSADNTAGKVTISSPDTVTDNELNAYLTQLNETLTALGN